MSGTRGIITTPDDGSIPTGQETALVGVNTTSTKASVTNAKQAIAGQNTGTVTQPGVETDGSMLWMRSWKLTIGPESGQDSVDLSDLAFQFSVQETTLQMAAQATITIYNVGDNIISRMEKELTNVYLEAGYRSPSTQYGKIFSGPISFFKHGKQSAAETFVEIQAMGFDLALNAAVINTTIPKGYTKEDIISACTAAMAPYGVSLGQIVLPQSTTVQEPRGRLLFGMASDVMRDVAQTENANYFIDRDGRLHIVQEGGSLPQAGSIPVLNSKTGMVGVPTMTMGGGVEVRCLLNPSIQPMRQIKLNNKDIVQIQQGAGSMAVPQSGQMATMSGLALSADGFYIVGSVKHYGENRGNPWYSDITTAPMGLPSK